MKMKKVLLFIAVAIFSISTNAQFGSDPGGPGNVLGSGSNGFQTGGSPIVPYDGNLNLVFVAISLLILSKQVFKVNLFMIK
jgi:hypothetical protein